MAKPKGKAAPGAIGPTPQGEMQEEEVVLAPLWLGLVFLCRQFLEVEGALPKFIKNLKSYTKIIFMQNF